MLQACHKKLHRFADVAILRCYLSHSNTLQATANVIHDCYFNASLGSFLEWISTWSPANYVYFIAPKACVSSPSLHHLPYSPINNGFSWDYPQILFADIHLCHHLLVFKTRLSKLIPIRFFSTAILFWLWGSSLLLLIAVCGKEA